MRLLPSFLYILVPLLLFTGCQSQVDGDSSAVFDLNTIRPIIEANTQQFTESHITRDSTFLADIFTEDARVYAPNSTPVQGRQAISDVNMEWLKYGIKEFRETSVSLYGSRGYIVDEGAYYLRYGDDTTEEGHYMNVWKQIDDEWKIYANMWTTGPRAE